MARVLFDLIEITNDTDILLSQGILHCEFGSELLTIPTAKALGKHYAWAFLCPIVVALLLLALSPIPQNLGPGLGIWAGGRPKRGGSADIEHLFSAI